ncbi:MAG: DUF92 domain-containing protein [Anaerolineaceae bacterium]
MSIDPLKLVIGAAIACFIALAARKAKALSRSGMWAAAGLGTIIMGLGGFGWAVLLMGFFISSSALSRMFKRQKAALNEKYAKGSQRDAGQVLANGGVAGAAVLLLFIFPPQSGSMIALIPWMLCASALAAANADTWATELGALSPTAPRLVTTLKPVERGTSGGVTLAGTAAALAGSAFIALLAVLFRPADVPSVGLSVGAAFSASAEFLVITLAGLAGSLVDSLLGATLQAIYWCPQCGKETESTPATPAEVIQSSTGASPGWTMTG